MKKIYKISLLLASLGLVGGAFGTAIISQKSTKSPVKTDALVDGDVEWNYLAFDGNNFRMSDDSNPADWVSSRTGATFWNNRSFNALDDFYDGFRNEAWTGTIQSASWKQAKRYVTFTLGGNSANKVEILDKDNADAVVATVQNTYFNDPKLSENMLVRVVDLNAYIGHSLSLKITDSVTSGFGATTFGALKVSQSQEDVARTISVHKNHLSRRNSAENVAERDLPAREYTLDIYANNSEWTAFDSVVLDNADMDFEDYYQCTNLALDTDSVTGFADKGAGFDSIAWGYDAAFSHISAWPWAEAFPMNKQGEAFFKGEYGGDSAQYNLLTHDFTLSGTGYVSIKLGGNGTKMSVIRVSDGEVLGSVTNTKFSWLDNAEDKDNCSLHDHRPCTMTRYLLDVSDYVGTKVRIQISDASTGPWSILMFDELITKYSSLPVFKLDKVSQRDTYYRVFQTEFVSHHDDKVKEAHDFISEFFTLARSTDDSSFCTAVKSDDMLTLLSKYSALSDEARAIVNASDDYAFENATPSNWYTINPTMLNLGETIQYIAKYRNVSIPGTVSSSVSLNRIVKDNAVVLTVIGVAALAIVSGLVVVLAKKRKEQR